MNKKKIIILVILFIAIAGFALAPASAAKYKGSFKLKYEGFPGPTYKNDGYKKEWRNGHNSKYGGSAEIYMYKNGKKVKKYSTLRVAYNSPYAEGSFKAKVKFRYWNGYKYTNSYKTKTYTKKYGLAYAGPKYSHIATTNWIPWVVKIYE